MENQEFGYSFYSLNQKQEDFKNRILRALNIFNSTIPLLPIKALFPSQQGYTNINGFKDDFLIKKDYLNATLLSENGEYEISIGTNLEGFMIGFNFNLPFLSQYLSLTQIINLMQLLQSTLATPVSSVAHVFDLGIVYGLYEPFDFAGRNSFFTGFRWLNYLGPEEMTLNGGKALYDLPYLTKVEPLGEGIFIQVGETPNDARTEQGKQQLFKATEAWWEMIQKKGG